MNRLSGIRVVVLDAVGTVISPRPSVKAIYTAVGRKYGSRLDEDEVDRRFRAVFRATERNGADHQPDRTDANAWRTSEAAERERWREIVATVLDDVRDQGACFDELFRHFATVSAWQVYADVGAALLELKARGLELALASNFDARLISVCDALPELAPISRRFISSLVGVRKPARSFFEAVIAECAVEPSQLLMVGDDATNDVDGALACGCRAVRVNRKNVPAAGEIATLSELLF